MNERGTARATGALSNVRVLDLTRVFSGPWATQLLSDFGADVVKVERPGRGDDVRHQGLLTKDAQGVETTITSSYLAMNRGKRSITLDISKPDGQEVVRRLVKDVDVLVENYKAGDLERYGLDYAALREINPRLVYCSITGFGQTGPYRHLPGYDPIFQSMSGLMSITGLPDGEPGAGPQRVGYSISDLTASYYAVIGILTALHYRNTVSGEGQYIDLALLDAQIASHSHIAMNYLVTGQQPPRTGTASQMTCPYQAFECADGHVMVAVGNDQQFRDYCAALGLPALAQDERYATNLARVRHAKELVPKLAEAMRTRSVNDWLEVLGNFNVPCGPINDFEQVFQDKQVVHRSVLRTMAHPELGSMQFVANPLNLSATPAEYRRYPPRLGEHTDEVLREAGYSDAEIARLRGSAT